MLILKNKLQVLEYEPANNILLAEWPNHEDYSLPEVVQTLETLVKYIREYNVKYLVINSTQVKPNFQITGLREFKAAIVELVYNLSKTSLKKIARIATNNPEREILVRNLAHEISQGLVFDFQIKEFLSQTEAKEWLLG
ncbi:hypothetical protein [Adhaeribacter aquaticus]|uniref:hypothetical protein n=1 Tax=Adhaeribacter aquaticus TaxID=299567 RepID=UPI00047AE918|nr:hypothetical protein [Adhaeribacter aquaticus]